jgi:G patch domain-containing protein 1
MRLLQKLGWRPGRGIGTAASRRTAAGAGGEEDGEEGGGAGRASKWGSVAGVSLDNTPLYVLEPKVSLEGWVPGGGLEGREERGMRGGCRAWFHCERGSAPARGASVLSSVVGCHRCGGGSSGGPRGREWSFVPVC